MQRFNRTKHCNCKDCPFDGSVKIFGSCETDRPKIALIGDFPRERDEYSKKAFTDGDGKYLRHALHDANILPHRVYFTNLISCHPGRKRFFSYSDYQEAIKCCYSGYLKELEYLQEEKVRMLGLLGKDVLKTFELEGKLSKLRGSVNVDHIIPFIPTYHPMWLIEGKQKEYPTWVNDLEKIGKLSKKPYQPPKEDFNCFPKVEELEAFVDKIVKDQTLIGIDIETTSLNPEYARIVVTGAADSATTAISFPRLQQGGYEVWINSDRVRVRKALKKLLLKAPTAYQNALFDVMILEANDYKVGNILHDSMILHHCIHPELPHNLGYITSIYGDTPYWKDDFLNRDSKITDMDDEVLRTYNLRDSVVLHQVLPELLKDLKETNTTWIYENIAMPLIRPVLAMIKNGFKIDPKRVTKFKRSLSNDIKKNEKKLRELANVPEHFSFNSADHLQLLIFNIIPSACKRAAKELAKYDNNPKLKKTTKKFAELMLKQSLLKVTTPLYQLSRAIRKTATGKASTDSKALTGLLLATKKRRDLVVRFKRQSEIQLKEAEDLTNLIDFLICLDKFRKLRKLITTYTDFPIGKDGRVHGKYKIHGTATGRLSSQDPNMQNIPKIARHCFICDEGNVIINADYINLELIMLAAISDDDVMQVMIDKGLNIHDENNKTLFGVTKDNPLWDIFRDAVKMYIFGRNYGGSLQGMYDRICMKIPDFPLTFAEFVKADEKYFKAHPKYKVWKENTEEEISSTRRLVNCFGRHRLFLGDAKAIIREGLNFPIQSAAGDLMSMSIIAVYNEFIEKKLKAKLICTVHDSLMVECPKKEAKQAMNIMHKHMTKEQVINGKPYQFKVDFEIGQDWGNLKEIKI